MIEALKGAGVEVRAKAVGPNPARQLPKSYQGAPTVARYTSPTYSEYAKLILKVSHNLGANLGICLMATSTGSPDCANGFPYWPRSWTMRRSTAGPSSSPTAAAAIRPTGPHHALWRRS